MRNHFGFSLAALALVTPLATAGGEDEDLDKIHIPVFDAVTVDATPGKGITFDAGDAFRMNITNRIQAQWRSSNLEDAQDVHTFRVRRARTRFKGHVFSPRTQFVVYLEWATGGNNMLDVYIQQEFWQNEDWTFAGRIGQMKTLYGREASNSSGKLAFVERSLAARTFSDNRATGGLLTVSGMEDRLHFHAGAFNQSTAAGSAFGTGPNTLNPDNEINFTGGVRFDVTGDMDYLGGSQADIARSEDWNASVQGNIWWGNEGGVTPAPDVEVFAWNIGGQVQGMGFSALAEYFMHSSEVDTTGGADVDSSGWTLHGTYTLENGWGVGGRISMVSVDDPGGILAPASGGTTGAGTTFAGEGDVIEYTFGVNKFMNGHERKVQLDVTYQDADPDVVPAGAPGDSQNWIFRFMVTLQV